jgi:DNA polymerase-3 subunit delta'
MPFRDVIGHRPLVRLLARSVRDGTLPPSLLFAGPRGVGKRLTAVATAQALNCPRAAAPEHPDASAPRLAPGSQPPLESALPFDGCGVCPTCSRIARGVYPDVLIVEPGDTGSIKIEQVRDVVDRAAYRPFEGRMRAVIMDEADALVAAAQHALLKTLEEPPPSSVFMLVSSRPDALLATVRSRCPRLRFRPLSPIELADVLMKQGSSEADARAIAATADGSVERALDARGTDLVDARSAALRVLAQSAATDDPRRRLESTRDILPKTSGGGASDREHVSVHLRAMASLLRDVALLSTRADSRGLANRDVRPALERLGAYHGDRGVRAFTAVDQALVALQRNAGVKIVADWVVLQL